MFAHFSCDLFSFFAREFPAKSEKNLDVYRLPKVLCYKSVIFFVSFS